MGWYPNRDEKLQIQAPVSFATGMAPAVSGRRWFRDADRNDIQDELPDWPPGPTFTLRSKGDRAVRRTGRALAVGVPLIAGIFVELAGAITSPFGGDVGESPQDRENEVEDFPVMWASPGAVARTVPWQLDPGRRGKGYGTDIVLTDRRLIFLGTYHEALEDANQLWEVPRDRVAEARQMLYSQASTDLRITFTDRSWIRLFTGSITFAGRFVELINGEVQALAESDLTDGQRTRVEEFISFLPKGVGAPTYTLRRNGLVHAEWRAPAKVARGFFDTHELLMDSSGAFPRTGDL